VVRDIVDVDGRSEGARRRQPLRSWGTHALRSEFAGINDLEAMAFLVILSASAGGVAHR
jgi:hypothetical protein